MRFNSGFKGLNTIPTRACQFATPHSRFQIIKRFPDRKIECHHRTTRKTPLLLTRNFRSFLA